MKPFCGRRRGGFKPIDRLLRRWTDLSTERECHCSEAGLLLAGLKTVEPLVQDGPWSPLIFESRITNRPNTPRQKRRRKKRTEKGRKREKGREKKNRQRGKMILLNRFSCFNKTPNDFETASAKQHLEFF